MGGQAVIGGVMLRVGERWAVSVRDPRGEIITQVGEVPPVRGARYFGVRGVTSLVSGLTLGTRALLFSAEQQLEEHQRGRGTMPLALAAVIPVVFFAIVFMALPSAVVAPVADGMWADVAEGVLRLVLVLGYIAAVGRMVHIAETFRYHGAEHQVVNCHEAGQELTVEHARCQSLVHARCGTSFVVVTVVVAALVFAVVPDGGMAWQVGTRLVGLPLVAALSYEVLRWSGSGSGALAQLVSWPGRQVQSLTVRPARDDQLEVAVRCARALVDAGPPAGASR